jgi:hypothetical protein
LAADLAADDAAAPDAAALAAQSDLATDLANLATDLADLAADLTDLTDLPTDLADLAADLTDLTNLTADLADLPTARPEVGTEISLHSWKLEETAGAAVNRGEKIAAGDDIRTAKTAPHNADLADLAYLSNLANLPAYLSDLASDLSADLSANLADLTTDLTTNLATDLTANLAADLPELAADRARAAECAKLAAACHTVKERIRQLIDGIRARDARAGIVIGRSRDRRGHEAAIRFRLEWRTGKRNGELNLRAYHLDFAQTKERQG